VEGAIEMAPSHILPDSALASLVRLEERNHPMQLVFRRADQVLRKELVLYTVLGHDVVADCYMEVILHIEWKLNRPSAIMVNRVKPTKAGDPRS
jgi:hypothetical protein